MMFLTEASAVGATEVTGVLDVLGSVFTFLISKIGDLVSVIMSQPLLLIPIGITVGYVIIRFFRSIFKLA